MKILALTHRLPYAPNRGDRIRSYHVLRHLRRDHDVEVASLVHDPEEQSHAHDLEPLGITTHVAPVPGLRRLVRAATGLISGTPLTHCLLDSPAMLPLLRDIVAVRRPDIVLAFCSSMARFALEPPLAGIPLVHDMMDVDSAKWAALSRTASRPKRWIYAREHRTLSAFERIAARAACATIVVNERERVLLRGLASDAQIEVVENGVDLERFQPLTVPADAPIAVFCGVMNYAPNEEAAIWISQRVWPLVMARRPDARLMLVGASPSASVSALASETITVTGTVPDTRPYLWEAAVGVAPLLTARGIQNKVLEAVAAGLPVVVTPQVGEGLPPEVASASCIAATPEAFAEAILGLFARTASERRAIAHRAELGSVQWRARLDPLAAIVDRAANNPRR